MLLNWIRVVAVDVVQDWTCLAGIWVERFRCFVLFSLAETVFELYVLLLLRGTLLQWLVSTITICHPSHVLLLSEHLFSSLKLIDIPLQSTLCKLETHWHRQVWVNWFIWQLSLPRVGARWYLTCSNGSHEIIRSPCCIVWSHTVSCHTKMSFCRHGIHCVLAAIIITNVTWSTSHTYDWVLIHLLLLLLRLKSPIFIHFVYSL